MYWIGPKPHERATPAPRALLEANERYIRGLSKFDQFLLWSYTTGSSKLNMSLIGPNTPAQLTGAVQKLFNDWPVLSDRLVPGEIAGPYWRDPNRFKSLTKARQLTIAKPIWKYVLRRYDKIISRAPRTPNPLVIYKTATPYGDLTEKHPGKFVFQAPLNSASWNRRMPIFYSFIMETETRVKSCCLFELHLPAGIPVLMLTPNVHAYPYEDEILLPMGAVFSIRSVHKGTLYYDPKVQAVDLPPHKQANPGYQKTTFFNIGPMSTLTKSKGAAAIRRAPVRYFVMDYLPPIERCVSPKLGNRTTADLKAATKSKSKSPSKRQLCGMRAVQGDLFPAIR